VNPIEILLVEDNAGDVLLIHQALAGEPYPVKIRVAMDGKQAVLMLAGKHFRPDLVILDLNIPKLSGLAVLECTAPSVPVVMFTLSSSSEDRRCAFELGVGDYVQKPTDLGDYMHQVSQIVRTWADLSRRWRSRRVYALAALSVPGLRKLMSTPRALSVSATVIKGIVFVRINPLEEAANDIAAAVI
jgi:DNA-binding response OmpR family regulator